jgi:hypothetical protein
MVVRVASRVRLSLVRWPAVAVFLKALFATAHSKAGFGTLAEPVPKDTTWLSPCVCYLAAMNPAA